MAYFEGLATRKAATIFQSPHGCRISTVRRYSDRNVSIQLCGVLTPASHLLCAIAVLSDLRRILLEAGLHVLELHVSTCRKK